MKSLRAAFGLLLVAFIFFQGGSALSWGVEESAGPDDSLTDLYRDTILRALEAPKQIGQQCPDCGITSAGSNQGPRMCADDYKEIYKKDVVDMRVVFGYLDYKNTVEDRYQRQAMVERVTAPCTGATQMCGFKRGDSMDIFEKVVNGKLVRLHLVASSASDNERTNRGDLKAQQADATARAKKAYFDGLTQSDVLLYVGHARNGGGPSFEPPKLKNGRTDLKDYNKKQESWKEVVRTLESTSTPPKIMGILACNAELHFGKDLAKAAPNSAVLLAGSKNLFESIFAQAASILESVIDQRCESDFNSAVNHVSDIDGFAISPIRMKNFFRGASRPTYVQGGHFDVPAWTPPRTIDRNTPIIQRPPVTSPWIVEPPHNGTAPSSDTLGTGGIY